MKKLVVLGVLTPLLIACNGLALPQVSTSEKVSPRLDYSFAGGRLNFDFSNPLQLTSFENHTVYGDKAYVQDGQLYSWMMCEQKIILSSFSFSDVLLDVDLSPLKTGGKINGGVYLAASQIGDDQDAITAWNVEVEHIVDYSYYVVRIHRFEQHWIGQLAESAHIAYTSPTIHLRVLASSGAVTVFTDYAETPILSYATGALSEGKVGLRASFNPGTFDNFQVTSPQFKADLSALNASLEEFGALKKDDYTTKSYQAAKTVYDEIKAKDVTTLNQNEIDLLTSNLKKKMAELIARHTYAELQTLIKEAEKITNDQQTYTQDSFASFSIDLAYAKALKETEDIDWISYWYKMLDYRMKELTRYQEGQA
jgi:hypothetical protein